MTTQERIDTYGYLNRKSESERNEIIKKMMKRTPTSYSNPPEFTDIQEKEWKKILNLFSIWEIEWQDYHLIE